MLTISEEILSLSQWLKAPIESSMKMIGRLVPDIYSGRDAWDGSMGYGRGTGGGNINIFSSNLHDLQKSSYRPQEVRGGVSQLSPWSSDYDRNVNRTVAAIDGDAGILLAVHGVRTDDRRRYDDLTAQKRRRCGN